MHDTTDATDARTDRSNTNPNAVTMAALADACTREVFDTWEFRRVAVDLARAMARNEERDGKVLAE